MKKTDMLMVLVGVAVVISIVSVLYAVNLNNKLNDVTGDVVEVDDTPEITQYERVSVSVDDDAFLGERGADIKVIEFCDFQDGECGKFYDKVLPLLKEGYIDANKVRFVYRDFPLGGNSYSQRAAEAAECAGEQDMFWEMHDKLFENQGNLDAGSIDIYAKSLDLDMLEFNRCFNDRKLSSEVAEDKRDGEDYGVTVLPTVFINGVMIEGYVPYGELSKVINQELDIA